MSQTRELSLWEYFAADAEQTKIAWRLYRRVFISQVFEKERVLIYCTVDAIISNLTDTEIANILDRNNARWAGIFSTEVNVRPRTLRKR